MSTDEQMAPYVAQFVPVKLDTGSDEYQQFRRKHTAQGSTIPKVFIVRADGETMFGESTSLRGDEMAQVLGACLDNCGRILSEREIVALDEISVRVAEARSVGDVPGAVNLLKRARKIGTPGDIGSFASAAVAVDQQAIELTQQAIGLLEPLAIRLGMTPEGRDETIPNDQDVEIPDSESADTSDDSADVQSETAAGSQAEKINALRSFLAVTEQYDGLASIKDAVSMVNRHISRDDELKPLMRAVKIVERAESARTLAAVEKSLESLKKILEDYPEGAMNELIMATGRSQQAKADKLRADAVERSEAGSESSGG